jgi:hypothetical protein
MSNDLKPCPFCGNEVGIIHCVGSPKMDGNWISCDTCERAFIHASGDGVKIWNSRAIEDKLKAEIESLKASIKNLEQSHKDQQEIGYQEYDRQKGEAEYWQEKCQEQQERDSDYSQGVGEL